MIYLLMAILSSASIALVFKALGSQGGNRYGVIIGNYLTCIVISLIMTGGPAAIAQAAPVTYLCGAVGGLLFVLGLSSCKAASPQTAPLSPRLSASWALWYRWHSAF